MRGTHLDACDMHCFDNSWRYLPRGLEQHDELFEHLARLYKQINAPVGRLGLDSLNVSTAALAGDDVTFARLENHLQEITNQRDALGAQIIHLLEEAEFNHMPLNHFSAAMLSFEAEQLLDRVHDLKESLSRRDDDDHDRHEN